MLTYFFLLIVREIIGRATGDSSICNAKKAEGLTSAHHRTSAATAVVSTSATAEQEQYNDDPAGIIAASTVVVAAARAAGGRGAAAAAADQNDDNDEPQAGVVFKAHERRSPHFFESELSYACFLQDET